jgi:hypothetical protein
MKAEPRPLRSEAGSAYIITLLALVVLTILALSVALVTQTEVQVGANEKTINRVFYAADSGLGIAAAEVLASRRYTTVTVILNRSTDPVTGVTTADRVTILPIVPFPPVRCDWCPANDDGTPKFWKVNHMAHTTTQRIAWDTSTPDPPANPTVLGQKTLSAMFEFEPFPSPPPEALPEGAALQQLEAIK